MVKLSKIFKALYIGPYFIPCLQQLTPILLPVIRLLLQEEENSQ